MDDPVCISHRDDHRLLFLSITPSPMVIARGLW
jgi:hypothetical protein